MAELVGSNIDPRLFVQDYSGYVNAGAISAQGISNVGNMIAGELRDYGKEQKDAKKALKASQAQIDAAIQLFPSQAEYLGKISNELKNEDTPLTDRAAVASGISEMIMMGVGEDRYRREAAIEDRKLTMQERESNMRQMATGYDITNAERQANQLQIDDNTKKTVGPALLEQTIAMLGQSNPAMAKSIKDSTADVSPEEAYSTANSIMGLIPKKEREKAPAVQDVPVAGGTQKMQYDPDLGKWVPIQTSVSQSGDPTNPDLPIYTPDNATDQELGMVLPPLNGGVGFTPTPPAMTPAQEDAAKMAQEKHQAEMRATQEKASDDVAKSEDMIAQLNKLENHPGFNSLFGYHTWGTRLPGTDGGDAEVVFKQIEGKGFIEAIQSMKGMGALSNSEGEKASAAFLGLSPTMSEKAAKERIKEVKQLVQAGIDRAKKGTFVNPDGSPMAPAAVDPYANATDRLNGMIPTQ